MKQENYDDDALVMMIAKGNLTYAQIAEEIGLAEITVSKIARGERRPELQPKIKAAVQGFIEEARRLTAKYARSAVARLGKIIANESAMADADVQRKASVDLLKFSLGDPGKPEVNVNQTQSTPGLSADDLNNLAKMKGGPE